jgi:dihydropteroate synthase
MHMRGTPETMAGEARYTDVVLEVKAELGARIAAATRAGIPAGRLWIDPGLGFAKTASHNLEILHRLEEFLIFEKPVVVGASRKSFLGLLLGEPDPAGRLEGSLAAAVAAVLKGAHVLRVHDVAATRRAVVVAEAIAEPGRLEG